MLEGNPEEVFAELYRNHHAQLVRTALRLAGNRADAEEIAQEAFLLAWKHRDQFQQRSAFSTWLYRIAVNVFLARQRRADYRQLRFDCDFTPDRRRDIGALDPNIESLPARYLLRRALRGLSPKLRSVFLHRVQGKELQEIASALNLSVTAVKARLHQVRIRLRKAMAP